MSSRHDLYWKTGNTKEPTTTFVVGGKTRREEFEPKRREPLKTCFSVRQERTQTSFMLVLAEALGGHLLFS